MSEVFGIEADIDTTQLSCLSITRIVFMYLALCHELGNCSKTFLFPSCVPAPVQFLAFCSNLAALNPIPQNWPAAVL